jgi:hypothetical protein
VNGRRPDSGSVVWTVLDALAVPQRNETLSDDLILFESLVSDSIGKLKGRAGASLDSCQDKFRRPTTRANDGIC